MRLLWGAIPNQEALKSDQLSAEEKRKILLIEKYKDYFYRFFESPVHPIYAKYYKLSSPAVTYLVISSPQNKVEAVNHRFPFVGSFPYIGFFDRPSALSFKEKEEKRGMVAWMRPVYAYSTLGYFNDPILSSFFYYDDVELANLIFHELFHTVFFIDDQVELNENLANFFAELLVDRYFASQSIALEEYHQRMHWQDEGLKKLVEFSQELNSLYEQGKKENAKEILEKYKNETIIPWSESYCSKRDKCWAKEMEYSNASLAAYMTYEAQDQEIRSWYQGNLFDERQFLEKLREFSQSYKETKVKSTLLDYLRRRFQAERYVQPK